MATDTFSANAGYYLDVHASIQSYNAAGNYSTIYYRIRVYKTSGGWAWATQNNGNSGWADSNLSGAKDLWNDPNLAFDFRNGGNGSFWTFKEGTFNVKHANNGSGSYAVTAAMTLFSLGSATATVKGSLTTAPGSSPVSSVKTPPAPKVIGFSELYVSSLRFTFTNNGNGGSPVLQWQIGYGPFASGPRTYLTSRGSSIIGGLQPSTMYYFWARGRNALGWGAWSARAQCMTLGGVGLKVGGVWKQALPYVKDKGIWKPAQPFVKDNGSWKGSG